MDWPLLCLPLVAFCLTLVIPNTSTQQNFYLPTGTLFQHFLKREYFAEFFPTHGDEPVTFIVNLMDHPDLPGWLRFTQRSEFDDGILYGMPNSEHIGKTTVEVLACNQRTYDIVNQILLLNVEAPQDHEHPLPHQAELYISNMNMEDFLQPDVPHLLQTAVRKTWRVPDKGLLRIANVTSALERGGRIPLPIHLHREGVYVLLGSNFPARYLRRALEEKKLICQEKQPQPFPFQGLFAPLFRLDACRSRIIDRFQPTQPGLIPTYQFEHQLFNPPSATLEPRNFCSDYALTIGLPLALILLLFLILSYIMCCRRKGLEKRIKETPELQLVHHDTIHDASQELRDLSKERDIRPLSTLPMFNVRRNRTADNLSQPDRIPLIPSEQLSPPVKESPTLGPSSKATTQPGP
uniref:epsilon-sarcoglycan-like n=1 Tax=Myxine glutinosa TaxID=7769 RepID=UPI00358F64BB